MSDEEDLAALRSGSADLIHRDFRGADLSDMDIGARDFSQSHLENTNFARSNLSGSNFHQANLMNLNVDSANLNSTNWNGALFAVNFRGADLRNSKIERSILQLCDFRESDLRGVSFTGSTIREGTQFEGALVDENTIFGGVQILRATARQEAFRFYEVDRGVLRRAPEKRATAPEDAQAVDRARLLSQIETLQADLRKLEPSIVAGQALPGLGHNNPPQETPIVRSEYALLQETLTSIKEQAASVNPDTSKIGESQALLIDFGSKILRWAARHADTMAEEFAKGLGKNLSDPLKIAAAWTLIAGGLTGVAQLVRAMFGL